MLKARRRKDVRVNEVLKDEVVTTPEPDTIS